MYTHTHTHTHTERETYRYSHTKIYIYTHTHTHTHTHTQRDIYTQIHVHTQRHTPIHIQTQTHTHTHTHTHTDTWSERKWLKGQRDFGYPTDILYFNASYICIQMCFAHESWFGEFYTKTNFWSLVVGLRVYGGVGFVGFRSRKVSNF